MRAVTELRDQPSDQLRDLPSSDQPGTKRSEGRKAYPGATLRHLGSVRDVTLLKTNRPPELSGLAHKVS